VVHISFFLSIFFLQNSSPIAEGLGETGECRGSQGEQLMSTGGVIHGQGREDGSLERKD
jgi:hypothetical protein